MRRQKWVAIPCFNMKYLCLQCANNTLQLGEQRVLIGLRSAVPYVDARNKQSDEQRALLAYDDSFECFLTYNLANAAAVNGLEAHSETRNCGGILWCSASPGHLVANRIINARAGTKRATLATLWRSVTESSVVSSKANVHIPGSHRSLHAYPNITLRLGVDSRTIDRDVQIDARHDRCDIPGEFLC